MRYWPHIANTIPLANCQTRRRIWQLVWRRWAVTSWPSSRQRCLFGRDYKVFISQQRASPVNWGRKPVSIIRRTRCASHVSSITYTHSSHPQRSPFAFAAWNQISDDWSIAMVTTTTNNIGPSVRTGDERHRCGWSVRSSVGVRSVADVRTDGREAGRSPLPNIILVCARQLDENWLRPGSSCPGMPCAPWRYNIWGNTWNRWMDSSFTFDRRIFVVFTISLSLSVPISLCVCGPRSRVSPKGRRRGVTDQRPTVLVCPTAGAERWLCSIIRFENGWQ